MFTNNVFKKYFFEFRMDKVKYIFYLAEKIKKNYLGTFLVVPNQRDQIRHFGSLPPFMGHNLRHFGSLPTLHGTLW